MIVEENITEFVKRKPGTVFSDIYRAGIWPRVNGLYRKKDTIDSTSFHYVDIINGERGDLVWAATDRKKSVAVWDKDSIDNLVRNLVVY